MRTFISIFALAFTSSVVAKTPGEVSRDYFIEVIKNILPISRSRVVDIQDFSTKGCQRQSKKWLALYIKSTPFEQTHDWSENCDLKGSFSPRVGEPFLVELSLRNATYEKVSLTVSLSVEKMPEMSISLDVKEGSFVGKGEAVKFKADYKVVINPFDKNFLKEDAGGSYTALGKTYSLKEASAKD